MNVPTILLTRHCSSVLTHKKQSLNKLKWLVSRTKALQKVSTKTAEALVPKQVFPGSGTVPGPSSHPKARLCPAAHSHLLEWHGREAPGHAGGPQATAWTGPPQAHIAASHQGRFCALASRGHEALLHRGR